MKRFIYVEVRDVTEADDQEQILSFDSVIVAAEDEDAAYREGWRIILLKRAGSDDYDFGHGNGALLNDYVREI